MIEIPRAALTADKVATEAEFFSFGTNDLTQTGIGLSRDDYVKFSGDYEDRKIFKADPFAELDQEGIGQLVEMGTTKGRQAARPNPTSVGFCSRVGMNYVSCSPYRLPIARVPIARMAAAQAAIVAKSADAGAETMRTA